MRDLCLFGGGAVLRRHVGQLGIGVNSLLLGGMRTPGFLDLAGAWDPSLGLVVAGAITVAIRCRKLPTTSPVS